ncbi:MAG: A/G-specific adenine glycosylase [Cyclobacteriaceae bacterium]
MIKAQTFSEKLIRWYTERKRDLPWRKNKDPYKVWLSEIILQQTRVEQGTPYYLRFVETYPTIIDLANAEETEVLRLWQGLGYYSRARNLHTTAKFVANQLEGVFPQTYLEIVKLKGVGPYTAAAIASICFNEPRPVVDGNVFRFASRYFGIREDVGKQKTRPIFENILSEHISHETPGDFNQAMMEYGSKICSPSPSCSQCVFNLECVAREKNLQDQLPVKTKKTKVKNRFLHYLVFNDGLNFLMRQRNKGDVWAHLYDFHLVEGDISREAVFENAKNLLNHDFIIEEESEVFQHLLSHQKIKAVFYRINLTTEQIKKAKSTLGEPYSVEEIVNLPKPKLIVNYLEKIGIKS